MKIGENCKTCEWHKEITEMRELTNELRGENAELTRRLMSHQCILALTVMVAIALLLLWLTSALAHRADARRLDKILSRVETRLAPQTEFYDNEGRVIDLRDEGIIDMVGIDVDGATPDYDLAPEAYRK